MRWQISLGIAAASLCAGVAIGFYLGEQSSPQSTDITNYTVSQALDDKRGMSRSDEHRGGSEAQLSIDELNRSMRDMVDRSNPKALVDELRMSTSDAQKHALMEVVMQFWADDNPAAAVKYAMEMESGEGRLDFLSVALGSMAKSDVGAALRWVDQFENNSEREVLLASVYAGYAKADPESAMTAAEEMLPGYGRDLALAKVAEAWAQEDIDAVFNWIETQPVDRRLQNLYGTVMVAYMQQDPVNAGYLIEDMASGSQKTALACQYSQMLAKEDIQAALSWAENLPDATAQEQALAVAVDAWLNVDVNGAFNYALQAEGSVGGELLQQVAVRLAHDDPVNASQSLSQFPEEMQPVAAKEVARIWATRDPDAAMSWISGLNGSPAHQKAVQGAVYPLVDRSPEAAFELASSVSDSSRYNLMRYAAKVWYEVDPGAVHHAINSDHSMSDYDKEVMLKQVAYGNTQMDLVLPAIE